MSKFKYHTGDRFGSWVLIGYIGNGRWKAKCDCGNVYDCLISHLKKGKSTSCMSCASERRKTISYFYQSEYISWDHMMQRCFNKNNDRYHQYGGRGITVCKEWESFDVFLADMGQRPNGYSLDRIDVDGNYNKENCRWATPKEQMRNLRTHKTKHCITSIAEKIEMNPITLRARLRRGWTIDRAIKENVQIKSDSISAKAREHGLPEGTVLCRVNRGWTLEKALSTPILRKKTCFY